MSKSLHKERPSAIAVVLQLWWQMGLYWQAACSHTGMEQTAFDQMLGLPDLPLCRMCSALLKNWAESDSRLGRGDEAWSAFQEHRSSCNLQAGAFAAATSVHKEAHGKIFSSTGKLFLVAEPHGSPVWLSQDQNTARTAA